MKIPSPIRSLVRSVLSVSSLAGIVVLSLNHTTSAYGARFDILNVCITNTTSETPTETPSVTPTPSLTPVPTPTNTPIPTNSLIPTHTPISTSTPTLISPKQTYTLGTCGEADDPALFLALAFSPDNQRIYTADIKKRLIEWNKNTAEILRIYHSDIDYPSKFQLTQGGKHIWLGGQYQGGCKIIALNTDTGEMIYSKNWNDYSYGEILPDESSILLGSGNDGAFLIDTNTGEIVGHYIASESVKGIRCMTLSPQGDRALIAEWGPHEFPNYTQATIWDLKTGKSIHTFPYYKRRVDDVFWSNDEKYIYLHSWANTPDGNLDDFFLDQYDVSTGEHVYRQVFHSGNRLVMSADGTRVLMTRKTTVNKRTKICYVDIINYFSGEILSSYPHLQTIDTIALSPDGSEILAGSNNLVDTAAAYLWSIADVPPVTVPTLIPYTPTPTFTPTPTPTPDVPREIVENYQLQELKEGYDSFAVHPITGDVIAQKIIDGRPSYLDFSVVSPSSFQIDMSNYPMDALTFPIYPPFIDMEISSRGLIYGVGNQLLEFSPQNYQQPTRKWAISGHSLHVVTERDRIPNTKVGNVLIHRTPDTDEDYQTEGYAGKSLCQVDVFDPSSESPTAIPLISKKQFPRGNWLRNMVTGPENRLFFITREPCKIFYLDDDGQIKEYFHFMIPLRPASFAYLSADRSFIIAVESDNYTYYSKEIWRLSTVDCSLSRIATLSGDGWSKIKASPVDGKTFYFNYLKKDYFSKVLYAMRPIDVPETPTPTPPDTPPTPTPTPVPGWLVLDGFGGIHSSNPDIQPPLLPYFYDYDIVRDLEPDPLGRGWFMLDGYGGIHRSSPDLPIPEGLPYFGFDIARNLEIQADENGYRFYMLDGYGVVHTTGERFNYGFFPWFGKPVMRDLEPDPNGNGWLVMDEQGYIYSNEIPQMETIRLSIPSLLSPVMRSFKRFPDEKTLLIDGWGGRHTNPYYPIASQNFGILDYLYFPGWDIIRDIETVSPN